MIARRISHVALFQLTLFVSRAATADDGQPAGAQPAPSAPGVRRALLICGLAGDAEHRRLFAESLELLYTGLTEHHGFDAENVQVLWGDEPTDKDGPGVRSSRAVAGRDTIAAATEAIRHAIQPDDELWVIVMGHAHYDGRYSFLNVAGDDLQHIEFGRLFEQIRCRQQVFAITTAVSGFYLKPLAAAGRVVIAATEPDLEVNETLFPHKLARALGSPPAFAEIDLDRDGRLTLFDIYLWSCQETAKDYVTAQLLSTEHALIDDTGDGRGAEIEVAYLTEELGGRLRAGQAPAPPVGDGAAAARIELSFPAPAAATTPVEKADAPANTP